MSKRIAALLAVLLTVAMVFGGCQKENTQDKENTAEKTSSTDTADSNKQKPLEINWLGHGTYDPSIDNDTPMQKLIEEKFNVKIKVVPVYNLKTEVWNTYWASGNTADFISLPGGDYRTMVEQGLVRSISEEMIRTNMPTWMKKVEELAGDAELAKAQLYNSDGKVYAVPFLHAPIMETGVMVIRQD
mgnify:CR=1 FL=1